MSFLTSACWSGRAFLSLMAGLGCFALLGPAIQAASWSDPAVDAYNIRIGTQTFGARYHFTTNTVLVETAEAIRGMGSDVIKFYMGKSVGGQYPGLTLAATVTNLTTLAQLEPSYRRVLDMPFRHFVIWSYCFGASGDAGWGDGFSASERQKEYAEIYDFTRHLLTAYNNSGKSFYLGHWEGDWYLLPGYNTSTNPTPTVIQGMIDWLNTRQQAVDDAMRNVPHANVAVYHYTEVNRVRDAMLNPPGSNQRLVNAVLPAVTNLDFVSWSSYDGMNLDRTNLYATLNYIEAHVPTNKASVIGGRRVWVGEYGWGGANTSAEQEPPTRAYLRRLLPWGVRFILFWEIYDNENKAFWLIDSTGAKTPCYDLHQRLANLARLEVARFREKQGRLPTDAEFADLVTPALAAPLPKPAALALSRQQVLRLAGAEAAVTATLTQGVYGDDPAVVWVHWGNADGGTDPARWAHSMRVGTNHWFNPALFEAHFTNLVPGELFYFRYQATNQSGSAWATNTVSLQAGGIDPLRFGCRLELTMSGYDRGTVLEDFPLLVKLGSHLPGFDYRQFASPNGGDLRFANASGTVLLPHEIDEWNTNGTSFVWVKVPALAGPADSIWAYWGNAQDTQRPASDTNGAVWSNGFELVWHLKEVAYPRADSALKHPAQSGGSLSVSAVGAIGKAAVLNGATSYLLAGPVDLGESFTLSGWVKVDPAANSIQTFWANKAGGSATDGMAWFFNSWQTRDGKWLLETGNGSASAVASTGTNVMSMNEWHHVALVVERAAGEARFFLDGEERTAAAGIRSDFRNNADLVLGRFTDGLYAFKGQLDEVRIESMGRSADWVWASWRSGAPAGGWLKSGTVVRTRPLLTCRAAAAGCILAWPASAVGFKLASTPQCTEPAIWTPVTNVAVLASEGWQLVLPVTDRALFFRLQSL